MLYALLSPAKKLDFKPAPSWAKATQPALLKDTAELATTAKTLAIGDIKRLMDLSPALAKLNFERFQAFDPSNTCDTKPAAFAFAGDVYLGLEAKTLTPDDVAFAQKHVGILSGLYGLLRPLDAIQPYRLEMGTALKTGRGKSLHEFWRDDLTTHLNSVLKKLKAPTVINLASDEYFDALDAQAIAAPVIKPVFKEIKNGKPMMMSFFFKKARGMMARFIIDRRLTTAGDLKNFDSGGYAYDATASSETTWIFSRKAKLPSLAVRAGAKISVRPSPTG